MWEKVLQVVHEKADASSGDLHSWLDWLGKNWSVTGRTWENFMLARWSRFFYWVEFSSPTHQVHTESREEARLVSTGRKLAHRKALKSFPSLFFWFLRHSCVFPPRPVFVVILDCPQSLQRLLSPVTLQSSCSGTTLALLPVSVSKTFPCCSEHLS